MKKFVLFLIVISCVCFNFAIAFADPTIDVGSGVATTIVSPSPSAAVDSNTGSNALFTGNYHDYMQQVPVQKVTTSDLEKRINEKGNDIIHIMQVVGRIACIIGFIICCILTIIGILGNKQLMTGALIGLVICGFAYAGITCGSEIVSYIAAWAAS